MTPLHATGPGPQTEGAAGDAEFDQYAADYAAGMKQPLKRALGQHADVFLGQKIRWMVRALSREPLPVSAS